MKLQQNTLLALCSVLEFAADPRRQLSAGEIAAAYRVSPHHLAKVLRRLGQAGLLHAARGVGGGYRFAGNAKRVTLLDVVELFEPIGPRRRVDRAGGGETERAIGLVLSEIDEIARATFGSITLNTMLKLMRREPRRARPAARP